MKNNSDIRFEKKEKYLLVTGAGERKELIKIFEGTQRISSAIEEAQVRLVLLDYREVNFTIGQTDTFNSVRFYDAKLPNLSTITAAIVVNEANIYIGRMWETVAQKRGYRFKVFTNMDEAERWLIVQ